MQPVMMESCHLFFSFRNRSSKERSNLNGMVEKPFAFAWLPLFPDSITCLGDGTHHLQLYRYHTDGAQASTYIGSAPLATPVDKRASTLYSQSRHSLLTSPSSLSLNASSGLKATGASATLQPIKDKLTITSLSCSTSFTQDETLLKLLRFPNSSDPMPDEEIASMLSKLKYCAQPELAKHIQPVLDGLFSILVSKSNVEGRFNAPVFRELVNIFAIVSDRRFHNFRLIVDRYLSDHFHFTAHSYLLRGMSQLVSDRNENGEAPQILRLAFSRHSARVAA